MSDRDLPTRTIHYLWRFPPSAVLLAAQLIFMALYAIFSGHSSQRALISATNLVVVMLAVWIVNRSPAWNWIAWTLAVPAFILTILSAALADSVLLAWSALLETGLHFYAAGSLIAYMMKDYEVTTDELYAAGATFTLIAWGFAYAYLVCQAWVPESFVSPIVSGRSLTFVEMLFLSFTNLSTSGLSDIVPASAWARVLIMLEQFVGVGYVAMVVSRLVGLTLQRQAKKRG